ncbi:unnamed protein product [Acanthoscelides obtectus]|uniref:Protein ABHD18 n=1 Tax=Acanthoscelides obtectus TaxID=200917 RepID=A0A9P0K321_ACAOB|nr:unnamed protein product [Acanthoscelides obtectus]CAK1629152.1 Protein ABHD18 [Acanthoscelides obtectus]
MPVSRLDVIYRKILLTKLFTKGWGSPENLQRLFDIRQVISNRETCYKLVPKDYPISIINKTVHSDCRIIEGKFTSPFAVHLHGLVPDEVKESYFQMVLPLKWPSAHKPICIHLAGTGDHYFWRRRNVMAKPLLKAGIGAIILENPYYGIRKPTDQTRSSVHYVTDIFVMGGCLILECIVLLNWCEQVGFGPLGVTGISMGGHGVMSESIDWDMLQKQYLSNKMYCEELSKSCKIVDDPFACELGRTPDIAFETIEDVTAPNVTPHQLITFINDISNCPEIEYKPSSHTKKLFSSTHPSIINLFKQVHPVLLPTKRVIDMKKRAREALWFMRGMMDECTHLKNFTVPFDTSLIISICAKADGYVPRVGVSKIEDIWPGATVKYVECGHVGAYLWYRKVFIESIIEAFNKAKRKIPPPSPCHHEI